MSRSNRRRENTRAAQRRLVLVVMGAMLCVGVAWLMLLHNSSHPKAHWSVLAQDALESGEIAKALKILQAQFQDSPDDVELLQKLSDLEFVTGQYEKSLEHFLQLAEQYPSMAAVSRMRAAHCTLKLDRLDETVAHLQEALRLNPQLDDARRMLITFYENLFLLREMREQIVLLDVHDQATAEDVAMFCSGDRLLYDTKENITQLEKLIKQDPNNIVLTAALAQNLIRTYQYERVRKLVNEVHSQTKSENRWRLTLVLIEEMFNSEKYAEAAEQLEKLPPAADRVPRTWIVRGRTARELGEISKACIAFRNAAALDRFDPEPWYALSQIHLSTGMKAEGNRELEHSKKLQQLTTLIEYALTLEEAEVPSYILQISKLLLVLEESRASQICLEWLISENWKTKEAVLQLRELKKRFPVIPQTLVVDSIDNLENFELSVSTQSDAVDRTAVVSRNEQGHQSITLVEVAADAGLKMTYINGHAGKKLLLTPLGGGVAAMDYDLDGWTDLFFPQGTPLPPDQPRTDLPSDRLFRNVGGERFDEVTTEAVILAGDYSHGVASSDWNSDGFPDLLVCNFGRNLLYRNNGDGTFTEVSEAAGITGERWSMSAAFGDFDQDGDLDLYIVNYVQAELEEMLLNGISDDAVEDPSLPKKTLTPKKYQAEQDRLFENLGNGQFLDITSSSGIEQPDGKGLGIVAADFDLDGRIDIFVGNDTTGNFLFHNSGQGIIQFESIGTSAGIAFNSRGQAEACMGIACSDVDHNGYPDLLVTNFEGETNTFYQNLGEMRFIDRTNQFSLSEESSQMLAWGAQFTDLNLDGWPDLFIANGHLHQGDMPVQTFINSGHMTFEQFFFTDQLVARPRLGRAVSLIDWNRDLRSDLVVTDLKNPISLLENRSGENKQVLAVKLIGRESNRDAIGARIEVQTGDTTLTSQVHGGGGYLSENERILYFGLGLTLQVDRVTIRWPSGKIDVRENLEAGKVYQIIEGSHSLTFLHPVSR